MKFNDVFELFVQQLVIVRYFFYFCVKDYILVFREDNNSDVELENLQDFK